MYELHILTQTITRPGTLNCELVELSADIAPNEFVAIVDPNGTPTSLITAILSGERAPTAGRVLLEGVSLYDAPFNTLRQIRTTQIGLLSHANGLRSRVSACSSVEAPLIQLGIHTWERRALAIEALQLSGITHHADHLNCELSPLQQMQVRLARAIVNKPRVLLVEIPHNALHRDIRCKVLSILGDLHSKGHTIVVVTDNSSTAAVAQRVISPTKRPCHSSIGKAAA